MSAQLLDTDTDAEAPCDACAFRARCAAELLACQAFSRFVAPALGRWQSASRVPTRARFAALFEAREDETTLGAVAC